VARKILWAGLLLAPATLVVHFAHLFGGVAQFVLAAVTLIPLAWLIGESTEHAGEHTGPGVGGFLNASFGNAPELIIAGFAISAGLPDVVRGSLAGSVVSNLLLVLGFAAIAGDEGRLDRRSLFMQLGLVATAVAVFLVVSVPGWHGDPNRHSLAALSIVPAAVLVALYVASTVRGLRRHRRIHTERGGPVPTGWSLRSALVVLGIATVITALTSEILVNSLSEFARSAGLSEFFVSTVIVAIVGNAAEHGGAVVVAHRGKIRLATEIAVSSSAQVALLVTPAVTLLSFVIRPPLALAFRPIELGTMAAATALVAIVIADGRPQRWEGFLLVFGYTVAAAGFYLAGDR
jgi:Ca2+:H+ antiporter